MSSSGKKYYGGFFWLAAISFIVPVFVVLKAFQDAAPTTKPTPMLNECGIDNAVWDYLLKAYVANGLIDYNGIKKDHLFREYLRELGAAKPDLLKTDKDRLALMCNAYNAFVINGVIIHKISKSVDGFKIDGNGFFDIKEHIFAGRTLSLNELENKMIRPTFKEPRVHVALVCAARSCPAIRAEAYVGAQIDQQLQDQSVQFVNNKKYVNYNSETSQLELSPILDWYGEDWDDRFPEGGYLQWIAELVEDRNLKEKVRLAISKKDKIKFVSYDWSLNSQKEPGTHDGGSKPGGFGSGSIQLD